MTDYEILKQAFEKVGIGFDSESFMDEKRIEINPDTESRLQYDFGNQITFYFNKKDKLKKITAYGE